jgi:hypothetical protein
MLTTVGVAVIAVGVLGLWARRGSQAPPAAERTELGRPAGIEGKGDAGFHAQVGSRVVKGSVEAVARPRPRRRHARGSGSGVGAVYDADRLEEEQQEQRDADFMTLQSTALHAGDPDDRVQALKDLDRFDAERTKPILLQALSDSDAQVRVTAIGDLSWNFGADAPFEPLARAAADGSPEVRMEALEALGQLDDERKLAVIKNALLDPDEDVRDKAQTLAFFSSEDEGGDTDSDSGNVSSDTGNADGDSGNADSDSGNADSDSASDAATGD